ncbi:MAG TPA: metallophosphoesterase [Pirellulaceae bacterium]|nr:metallophosphoesterase [Pirellulaceae bacterium]HMO93244.1 metallophosphoesterase [Pirellulaceae bacterium]HMP69109.1 metallophosphoesterase [Pirellulaceae bacterium]
MFKFIHAADIHLDSPLLGLDRFDDAPVAEIRVASRRALKNLVDLAIEEAVDFVLLAGDIYDGEWEEMRTGFYFVAQMARLREADIPVFLISGNHDAANKMTRKLRLPANVQLLPHNQPHTVKHVRLDDLGVALHGQSFERESIEDNLALNYPARIKGMFNIGLLHTSLTGAAGHYNYAPCTIADLKLKGYDYWALGHIHQREVKCQEPYIVYPGNLQGRKISETGAKGCYLVTVDSQLTPSLEFKAIDVFRYEKIRVDLDSACNADDLLEAFALNLEKTRRLHKSYPLAVRVELVGRTLMHERLLAEVTRWRNELKGVALDRGHGDIWLEKVIVNTLGNDNHRADLEIDGPLGELMACFDACRNSDELLQSLAQEFEPLRSRLPDEFRQADFSFNVHDLVQVRRWLDEAEALLLAQLRGEFDK